MLIIAYSVASNFSAKLKYMSEGTHLVLIGMSVQGITWRKYRIIFIYFDIT